MNIKIIGPATTGLAHGTRVFVDGRELEELSDISLHFPVDGVVALCVRQNVTEQFVYEGNASLIVTPVVLPGFELVATPQPDGSWRYHAERQP